MQRTTDLFRELARVHELRLGPSREPLLGETIGDNLDCVAVAHPDVERLVSRHQELRYMYAEFPMTVTGKVRKVEMREISTQRRGLDAAASIETA